MVCSSGTVEMLKISQVSWDKKTLGIIPANPNSNLSGTYKWDSWDAYGTKSHLGLSQSNPTVT